MSAKLTKGASVSRNEKIGNKCEQKQKNGNKYEQKEKTILACVRTHAPIASRARHFPPYAGEATAKEKKSWVFIGVRKNSVSAVISLVAFIW